MLSPRPYNRLHGQLGPQGGNGVVMVIGGKVYPLIRLDLDHVLFQAADVALDQVVALTLAPWNNLSAAVAGKMTIRACNGQTARGDFHVTMALLRFMIQRLGSQLGHSPTYFT